MSLGYRDRLDYELKMMQQMGFAGLLPRSSGTTSAYARKQRIPVGPGRGSAAGSLVAYAMGITNIDPVHHGLLFERFLNPERKSMPDIDTDFCIDRREEVIKYVTEKYGTERVAQIITYNRMTSKAVLKDTARVLNIPYGDVRQNGQNDPRCAREAGQVENDDLQNRRTLTGTGIQKALRQRRQSPRIQCHLPAVD